MPITRTFDCLQCGKHVENQKNGTGKYCSVACQHEFQYSERISIWKSGGDIGRGPLRRYLTEINNCCWECGIVEWNHKPITLEVEHVDGNAENNKEDNLKLLCPNCHSQTDTYKAKNKGNGRHTRRQRYQDGKSF